ncbi:polysaccharide biosynthesis tyrosine autokinase [Halobacillus litoralis]|uniref:Polysaccharide biosynthesis tyrosine autokinase n=1 Tax=Halobacillus litoralis TaxID=45668 RepID=A0A845E0K7_9BACI|nr:CpsD/CapB family tyrosine-protein kinase [Halobacillus litoralis]MYL49267.1 polysaccharide biosynthesis tyrosine autokinase [Halobacillus litoralis]
MRSVSEKVKQRLMLNEQYVSTQQIRMIQIRLNRFIRHEPSALILTSVDEHTENSLVSAKLAMAMAQQGKRVLLVDTDLSSPALHVFFQNKNEWGWANAVQERRGVRNMIRETMVPNLCLLTTGMTQRFSHEMWMPEKIKGVVEECKKAFDLVLFTAPPFLSSANTQLLTDYCEGVILVARTNKSKKEKLVTTVDAIERSGREVLGTILQTG